MRFFAMILCVMVADLWAVGIDEQDKQWGKESQSNNTKWEMARKQRNQMQDQNTISEGQNIQEFMISYRAKLDNSLLSGEEYKVSKVLHPRGGKGVLSGEFAILKECQIIPSEMIESNEMQKILKSNKEQVLECLYPSGVQIYDEAMAKNLQAKSKTILTLQPKRVLAVLRDGVVELSVLEKR